MCVPFFNTKSYSQWALHNQLEKVFSLFDLLSIICNHSYRQVIIKEELLVRAFTLGGKWANLPYSIPHRKESRWTNLTMYGRDWPNLSYA